MKGRINPVAIIAILSLACMVAAESDLLEVIRSEARDWVLLMQQHPTAWHAIRWHLMLGLGGDE